MWHKLYEIKKRNAENLSNGELFKLIVREQGYSEKTYIKEFDIEDVNEYIDEMKADGWLTLKGDNIVIWADIIE